LLIFNNHELDYSAFSGQLYDDVDVISIHRSNIETLPDKINAKGKHWKSISLLFHGDANLDQQTITMLGVTMTTDRNIADADPHVQIMVSLLPTFAECCDILYLYSCTVGLTDGLKELCIKHGGDIKGGIILNTTETGATTLDSSGNPILDKNGNPIHDWTMKWGTKNGYLVSKDKQDSKIMKHAQRCLFLDVNQLNFSLRKL